MGKVNSKQKGSRFERSICKFFQDWTGYEFSRVPASGGLRWKKTDNITSDITCSDPKHSRRFSLSVECKSYQEIKFEHLLLGNKSCKIMSFWEQACSDAKRANKVPILIMKYNNMPKDEAFFMVDKKTAEIIFNQLDKLEKPRMAIQMDKNQVFYIFMLSDIKNISYSTFHKEIRKSLKPKK